MPVTHTCFAWQTINDEIKRCVTSILQESKTANQTYQRLVHQYPESTLVLRLYASFVCDVRNDTDVSAGLIARAERLESETTATSPTAKSKDDEATRTRRSTRKLIRQQSLVQRRRHHNVLQTDVAMQVAAVHSRLRWGVVAMLVVVAIGFFLARSGESTYFSQALSLGLSAQRRTLAIDSAYAVRSLQLTALDTGASEAQFGDAQAAAMHTVSQLGTTGTTLFLHDDAVIDATLSQDSSVPMEHMSGTASVAVGWRCE